jgi:uncharacterized protein YkwD
VGPRRDLSNDSTRVAGFSMGRWCDSMRAMLRRALPLVAVMLPLAVVPSSAAAASCAGADILPTARNLKQVRTATLCLLNRQRRAARVAPLRASTTLQRAATGFSLRMVREDFFDHTAPDGTTFDQRIEAAGYGGFSTLAENIAWGSGSLSTPSRIVDSWMHSPGHRRNILDRNLRDIGIGIAPGAPQDDGGQRAATYTTDFGRR